MEKQNLSQKIIRNTIFNIIGRGWGILIALFLTPYIISHIGVERYGMWAIIGAVTGYFGLFDFGIGTSFVKYISEFYTKKDCEKINQVVNTGFLFYSIFAIFIITLAFFIINPLLVFFKIPSHLYNEAFFVFLLGIILFSISNALSPFRAIQDGLQRMDITNKVTISISIPIIIGTIFFLEKGYGLPGLMVNNAIVLVISSAVNIIIAFKILPELKFNLFSFNKGVFKKLFGFGYKLQISRLANLISFQTDKLLITYFLGIGLVVFYQLGSLILQKVRQIPLVLISALIPAVSEIDVKKGKEPLIELYLRGSKYLIFISTPVLFFMVANASLIMLAWMGQGYEKAALVIQILAIGYFAATVTGVASSITAGIARTELSMKFGIFMTVLNLFLSIILIIKIGFIGAVLGTTISLTVASFFFMKMFHNYIRRPLSSFIQLFYKPLIACTIPILIMFLLNYVFRSIAVSSARLVNLIILGLNGIVFSAMYIGFILLSKYFDEYDLWLLKNKIPLLKYLLR
ncbi:MAG: oligosaccharide flippase family protein [Candidatus Aureabacteria bacterium]|nr:oligosaccharide flippase family protein [Candidatus Auribacterota bacterium]